ncbi:MAG: pilus assembly protein [Gemmataceae bacterium]|nr:pilus assembly protein [Gemmataceae bacterium]
MSQLTTGRQRGGAAAVEFAFVFAFVLLPILIGLWELARLWELQQLGTLAANHGARLASMGLMTNTQVQNSVRNYLASLTQYGFGSAVATSANIIVTNSTYDLRDASSAMHLDRFDVTVQLRWGDARWSPINFLLSDDTYISSSATFYSCRNSPISGTSYAQIPWP